jgi:hypothetical protein
VLFEFVAKLDAGGLHTGGIGPLAAVLIQQSFHGRCSLMPNADMSSLE